MLSQRGIDPTRAGNQARIRFRCSLRSVALLGVVGLACGRPGLDLQGQGVGGSPAAGDVAAAGGSPGHGVPGSGGAEGTAPVDGPAQGGAAAAVPPRFIVMTTYFGHYLPAFGFDFPAPLPDPTTAWERPLPEELARWRPALRPLHALRDDVIVVEGLAQLVALEINAWSRFWDHHHRTALTGRPITPETSSLSGPGYLRRSGPSLDVAIGTRHTPPGGLPIAVAYSGYQLDFSTVDLEACAGCAGTPARLGRALLDGSSCAREIAAPGPDPRDEESLSPWFDRVAPLVVGALRCDRTRVFALHGPAPGTAELGVYIAGNLEQDYIDRAMSDDPVVHRVLTRYGQVYAEKVAALAEALRRIPAGDGTLLDYTVILWAPGEARIPHEFVPWNAVLVGGRKLGLRTGRYLHVAQDREVRPYGPSGPLVRAGGPHNWLLSSLARLYEVRGMDFTGESITLVGEQSVSLAGEVPGLLR